MQPKTNIEPEPGEDALEVVVGVFNSHEQASRAAASVRDPDLKVQRVSRTDPTAPNEMPEIVYDDIEEVSSNEIANGAMIGGAIGAGSGLLLFAIPGLNVAAPIAGALAGAWIGSVAGIDEASRGIELPNQIDYRKMLAQGKSFVVVAGDEKARSKCGMQMVELGAEDVHQHPPIAHAIRSTD
ncbi:hypothetical protein [Mariniblastus fucicola]|uniref:DUF1269 domain-containing protein n=1 Tax=Mariniblastus fucicola TaxID=980251 RepID=A0A5B9PE35_9BACT|nr:hypothetical protein [Mariniblastus fucicola]QEG24668.1 hypothetical protein MFFC18_45890 [Mariniblastus fucicola]